ncbi:atp-binding cassette transporter subfamily a abca [Anaeramoeba flamelloides]|uniref:Atp-binding cassette transporter subfamily a abca n=1 Tax=Anaeramoeba flamelloides TaxID=1746091 RepID=A0ABQ8YJP4_9EUKA|nr:atp-binding cassette transporter subfamily a abca [Anaeramoeba flamelloides]
MKKQPVAIKYQFFALLQKNLRIMNKHKAGNFCLLFMAVYVLFGIFLVQLIGNKYLTFDGDAQKNPPKFGFDFLTEKKILYSENGQASTFKTDLVPIIEKFVYEEKGDPKSPTFIKANLGEVGDQSKMDDYYFKSFFNDQQPSNFGYHFESLVLNGTETSDNSKAHFSIYYNSTRPFTNIEGESFSFYGQKGSTLFLPTAVNTFFRSAYKKMASKSGSATHDLRMGLKVFPKLKKQQKINLVELVQQSLILIIFHILFSYFFLVIVADKEAKIISMMYMMGLKSKVYWLVHYCYSFGLYLLYCTLFLIAGYCFRLSFFTNNSFWVLFFLIIIWGNVLIPLSIVSSTFFKTQKNGRVFINIFMITILAGIPQLWQQVFEKMDIYTHKTALTLVQFVPSISLYNGLTLLSKASSNGNFGVKLSDLNLDLGNVGSVFFILFIESIVLFALAYYFWNAMPPINGRNKNFFFFVNFFKKMRKKRKEKNLNINSNAGNSDIDGGSDSGSGSGSDSEDENGNEGGITDTTHDDSQLSHDSAILSNLDTFTDKKIKAINKDIFSSSLSFSSDQLASIDVHDPKKNKKQNENYEYNQKVVFKEKKRILNKSQLKNNNINIYGASKVYKGMDNNPDKTALDDLYLGIKKGECFGLLGPNGAGKTTLINILSGLYRQTKGKIMICGHDNNKESEIIHTFTGICTQEDRLWDDLNGQETLEFYAKIHGFRGQELKDLVAKTLNETGLYGDRKKKIKEYSGGMKRRMSVGCAIIVQPKILYLDEPTTGLDPKSKRDIWDILNTIKGSGSGTSIILTTHSMEEAEALSDRIGILNSGKLHTIGTSQQLKSHYGKIYKLAMKVGAAENEKLATDFIKTLVPKMKIMNSISGFYNISIPKKSITFSNFFNNLRENSKKYNITDWGISQTTLEEVFIKITSESHLNNEIII